MKNTPNNISFIKKDKRNSLHLERTCLCNTFESKVQRTKFSNVNILNRTKYQYKSSADEYCKNKQLSRATAQTRQSQHGLVLNTHNSILNITYRIQWYFR